MSGGDRSGSGEASGGQTGGSGSGHGPRREPERVGGLVGGLLRRLGLAEKVRRARAAAEWEQTVGPHIARVTRRPVVRGRTLFVEVESAAWLAELHMKRRELLRRLNSDGRDRVEKIVFVQSGGRETGTRPDEGAEDVARARGRRR